MKFILRFGVIAASGVFGVSLWAATSPAQADHCVEAANGIVYCFDTVPPSRTHTRWPTDGPPLLPEGSGWTCNLHSHPRTICVSYDLATEPPVIEKYLADDPKAQDVAESN